jgi:hypothetical protein
VALLEALRADARLACVVACSSRDSLDAVAAALHNRSRGFNLAVLVRRDALALARAVLLSAVATQQADIDAACVQSVWAVVT